MGPLAQVDEAHVPVPPRLTGLGSFLVALVQLLRIMFEYLKRETKSWADRNKCFKIMYKVITIILLCFEKCLKFITKNAYIMIAMQGHAFCDSCCHAFKL